ncbi:hypothetical protein JKF63_00927 [Porcisia hertigi]|uniref:Rib72 protein-like protein n=1 Tax=Porcisia hertigi TaxID=2761500 RepID=A0A836L1H7_9TRYP|nr:hypothetical protein JKF63_00927 [Porcisia hertigi]
MSLREKTVYNALPKLPGFTFSELQHTASHGKRQYCTIDDEGTRIVKDSAALDGAAVAAATAPEGCGIPVRVILQHFPSWRTLDNKVLRFFAYYTEKVVGSSIETWRVRKVKIHYFLADGSLNIIETPAVVNSGLPKGTTVSRFRPDEVDVFRMCIGATITCRGLTYQLVDCDAFTREFFEVMGMPQPEPLEYPLDNFEAKAMRCPGEMDEQHIEMRRVFEVQAATRAGTHASLLTPAERIKARDFYEYDRNVLRFYAVWEKRKFRIYYFLADGSIAVLFDNADNDGRDPYPVFVRRRRIPKESRAVLLSTETLNRPQGPPPACLTAEDLRTGSTVDIFTRPFFIYDCDEHTREYMEARGIPEPAFAAPPCEGDEIALAKQRRQRTKETRKGADASGKRFGASTMVFDDSPPEKDVLKLTRYAQDVFRFGAELVEPSEENEGRQFMICYYLADDTVSVYELQLHNSGHIGGKIFSRRAVEHVQDPTLLKVGNTIRLDGVDYRLREMDERTKRYLEMGMPNMDEAYFRTLEILSIAASHLHQQFSRITDAFRHYASSSTQGLTRENVREVLSDAGIHATEAELTNVMERADGDKDGWVSLADFTEQLMQQQFISTFKPRESVKTWGDARNGVTVQRGPVQSAMMLANRADAEARAQEALQRFLILIEARRTLAIRSLRATSQSTYDSNLSMSDFQDCLKNRLKTPMTDDEIGALLYRFYYTPGVNCWTERRLSLQEIQRTLLL